MCKENEFLLGWKTEVNEMIFFSSRNPDGTTSAVINLYTNYVNYQNNATQNALDKIGAITVILRNTSTK